MTGVDWVGRDGASTARRYAEMATHVAPVSPSYERICLGVASDPDLLERLDTLPTAKRQPNLLLGAVRLLDGPVDSYDAFRAFVRSRWDDLAATMRAHRTQTNEPRRLATLLPVLASLPQPLALLEVGTSAGLCLYPDRYGYRYDGGPVLGNPDLVLDCATEGPVPLPTTLPEVAWRGGIDLNPMDVGDHEDVRWLESLIWPEQTERFATLHAAVEIAADRPLVWLANEVAGVAVAPGDVPDPGRNEFVLSRDGEPLGLTESHGTRLRWFARSAREWSL